jgi:hypothetical protein
MRSEELKFLYRVLAAVKSYLDDFLIIGGFASLLYQFHDRAKPASLSSMITYDLDIATAGEIPVRDDALVHQLLLETGLKEELVGASDPPLAKYSLRDGTHSLYYVEFLTPLSGSESRRSATPDLTQLVQPKLSAQKLRYLDLLFQGTWAVCTSSIPALQECPNLVVRIPHPSMFIMQKILISKKRQPRNRAKDFAYIYLTLAFFRGDLKSLAGAYQTLVKDNELWKKWFVNYTRIIKELFGTPNSIGSVEASPTLDRVTPDMICAVLRRFISDFPTM